MRRQARRIIPALHVGARILVVAVIGSISVHAQVTQEPVAAAIVADATPAPRPAAPVADVDVAGVATPVSLLVGRSTLIDTGSPIARVSLTSATIADAMVTAPSQLLLHGKEPGSISMLVWSRAGAVMRFEVAVQRDLSGLDTQIKSLFPAERIQVHANGRQVVLSGTASSQDVIDKAKNVASGFVARAEDVVMLLQLQQARSNQVLLRVRFAEVSRNALTELGASFFTSPTGVNNVVGRVTTGQFSAPSFSELEWTKAGAPGDVGKEVTSASGKFQFSDFLNLFLLSERYDVGLLVRALQNQGLFQSLAEPNLVAESGKEASFLAGGEFPIPVAQGTGSNTSISVQFKEFGIRLSFTPIVDGDRVHLKVRPEVSTLDYANAVTMQGFRIPALTTRRTETELELRDGQTFAIAGLINNQMNSTLQKIPGLGDIPILGYLFKSKAAQKGQTELVVMITPEILPVGSSGVTGNMPRMQEPFMAIPPDDKLLPTPPGAFTPERNQLTPKGPAGTASTSTPAVAPPPVAEVRDERAAQATPQAPAQRAEEDARQQQVLTERARKDAEQFEKELARLQKAEAERVKKEAEQARKDAEQATKDAARAMKAAAEQARKDEEQALKDEERAKAAGAAQAKHDAELAAKAAGEQAKAQKAEQARLEKLAKEQARRDAEAAAAEAKLRAAYAEYQAKVGKSAAQ